MEDIQANSLYGYKTKFCSVKCASSDISTKNKTKNTCLKRFGTSSPMQSNIIKKKSLQTLNEKYGCTNISQLDNVKQEKLKTFVKNFPKNSLKRKELIDKKLKTMEVRYGKNFKNIIGEKVRNTSLKRFGTPSPILNSDIKSKSKSKYKYDGRFFDSFSELTYYFWLKNNNISFEYKPNIYFLYYDMNGKKHRYYPDFKVNDKFVEIKGDHFFTQIGDMINPYLNEKIPLEERDYQNNLYKEKFLCMKKNSIIILKDSECSQFKEYFLEKMGFHSFQNAKESLKIQKK